VDSRHRRYEADVCGRLLREGAHVLLLREPLDHLFHSQPRARLGVSRKTISTIEVGRFVPSTVIALRIAKHFGVAVEEIFSLEDARPVEGKSSQGAL
jgi:DNA-binding XRE family transcriptional regulator